jgi:hypothetical protein
MKKKLFAMVVACAVLLGMTACGSESIDTPEDSTPAESTPADYSVPPQTPEETAGEDEEHEESLEDLIERNNITAANARRQMTFLLAHMEQIGFYQIDDTFVSAGVGQIDDTVLIIDLSMSDGSYNVTISDISSIFPYKTKPEWWSGTLSDGFDNIQTVLETWFNLVMSDVSDGATFSIVIYRNMALAVTYSSSADINANAFTNASVTDPIHGITDNRADSGGQIIGTTDNLYYNPMFEETFQ